MQGNEQNLDESDGVYVVLCAGSQWRDVYRMVEGHCLTIGRESSNRIVVSDDRCSRRHCEVFFEPGGWMARDLGSSNGTEVNGNKISRPTALKEGDRFKVGHSTFLFTHDITQPLATDSLESPTAVDGPRKADADSGTQTEIVPRYESETIFAEQESDEPEIFERKSRSRYVEGQQEQGLHKGFAGLYRLVSDMVAANDLKQLAGTVLNGLFDVVKPDIGAILLLSESASGLGQAHANDLRIMSFRAPDDAPYHRISDRLSDAALKQGDGTLSMNVGSGDSSAVKFETLQSMNAQSVICAPIRDGDTI
jgi:two-component system response regulator HydG